MEIIIVRHGKAGEPLARLSRAERERPLTSEGRKETAAVGRGLRALDCRPGRVLASPLLRARQTAEILAPILGVKRVKTCSDLRPGGDPRKVIRGIGVEGGESVLLVGHMPDLGDLTAVLLSGKGGLAVAFKKSGACRICFDGAPRAGGGRLDWLLQPAHLRAVAKRRKA